MRKLILVSLAAGFSLAGFSQVKPVVLTTIKTPEALCEQCKIRIETYLKRHDGVAEATVNWRKGETKVKYITDRINIEEIKTAIANVGYEAGDVPATEDAYNRLPLSCKKFSDGGGHPKPKVVTPVPPSQ